MIPFGLSSLMTVSLPIGRRATKCLIPGASAVYLFNEGSGTVLRDHSGNGYDGTLGAADAAPTWATEGLAFDAGDYVTCGTPHRLFAAAGLPFTVQVATTGASEGYLIARARSNTDAARTFYLRHISGKIYLGMREGGVIIDNAAPATPTLYTVTWDGAAAYYYRGTGPGTDFTANVGTAAEEAVPVTLGAKSGDPSGYSGGLNGTLNAVTIYPFALAPAQIAQNHAALAGILAARGVTLG